MAIRSIRLDESTFEALGIGIADLPLSPGLRLRSLGNLVVLAGANGSGKSRFLALLQKLVSKHIDGATRRQLARNLRQARDQVKQLETALVESKAKLNPNETEIALADSISKYEQTIAQIQENIYRLESDIRAANVLEMSSDKVPPIVSFVPRLAKLVDPARTIENDAEERAARLRSLGTDNAEMNAPAYARSVLRAALRGRDERRTKGGTEPSPQEAAEIDLLDLVRSLVGVDLVPHLDDTLNLVFGLWRSYEHALSAGQQVLFQFACLLHAQEAGLQDCIVLMDEPENHLHPAVLNQVIDKLRAKLTDGQLWIATHSVPLVAHAVAKEPECLWYVEAGRVEHAGRSPEKVLEGLMGGPAGAQHLHDFTLLPAKFAALRFLSECLMAPGVVGPDVKDPQTNQVASLLQMRQPHSTGKVRVLDYGAGRARLLTTLAALKPPAREWLDYFAFDVSNDNEAERQRELEAVYGVDQVTRSFTDLVSLPTKLNPGSVDVIVMCNVLHEVDPSQWHRLFGPSGVLTTLLSPDGVLLIVEDYGIPVGERAHRFGFLLLNEPELVKLFAIDEDDGRQRRFVADTPLEARYQGRLVAHVISVECLRRYSAKTQHDAIQMLHQRMSTALDTMLEAGASAKEGTDGRDYARTAQLMANAAIWLQHHGER